MIAIDAELSNRFAFGAETIALDAVAQLMKSKSAVSIILLDACRDNPFLDRLQASLPSGSEGMIQRGLAPLEITDAETIVMYAAASNSVALDGNGRNSPFASALMRHLSAPDTEIAVALRRVIRDVRQETKGLQSPELLVATGADVFLNLSEPMAERATRGGGPLGTKLSDSKVRQQLEELRFQFQAQRLI